MTPSLRIVVADDEADTREFFERYLPRLGHQVVAVAEDGRELVDRCRQTNPDLIVTDVRMPGLDGLALARQLRARGWSGPLLAVTARADADAEPAAREAGFDGFLRKPLTGALLAASLEQLLPAVRWDEHDD